MSNLHDSIKTWHVKIELMKIAHFENFSNKLNDYIIIIMLL